jgi:hypothetical protein
MSLLLTANRHAESTPEHTERGCSAQAPCACALRVTRACIWLQRQVVEQLLALLGCDGEELIRLRVPAGPEGEGLPPPFPGPLAVRGPASWAMGKR